MAGIVIGTQVRVLYDFDGDADGGELTIREGQVLTVTNQDVGDGWWEGRTETGEVGLFPETYVEETAAAEAVPSAPPAPVIPVFQEPPAEEQQQQYDYDQSSYGQDEASGYRDRAESWDDGVGDGDEWDESGTHSMPGTSSLAPSTGGYDVGSTDGGSLSPRARTDTSLSSVNRIERSGTVRRNINRFSTFVKSGGEAYILGETKVKANASGEELSFFLSAEGPRWTVADPFTLQVREPTKKSKLKGIKSFIAYTITLSSTGQTVERRYKHFDWLHDRLIEKFTLLSVPPLPDKQYSGRYGEDFIEKRRERLEMWLNRVARHPVISKSTVFQHFLTCVDEKQWKTGKRRAEKDELVGSAFFVTVQMVPDIDTSLGDQEVDQFGRFVKGMDDNMLKLKTKCEQHCEQYSGTFTREYQKLGMVFTKLSETFALEEKDYARAITEAFGETGRRYDTVAKLYEEQPKNDLLPLMDIVREYLGILSTYPDIVEVHKDSMQKIQQCRKLQEEEKMADADVQEITERGNVLTASVLSEINHFHSERVIDLKAGMQHFLQEQIKFHQDIIGNLQSALEKYESC